MKCTSWRSLPLLAALACLVWPAGGNAQEEADRSGILTSEEVRDLVRERARETRPQRSALQEFLERDDVARVAEGAGIDILDARSAAAMLEEREVRRLSPVLDRAEAALAGGDTIVLSSTAVIIGLLILILILVA